jgi:hypothetical protein
MNEHYRTVGTKPKKYHILENGFVSEFDVRCGGRICHCELLHENPDYEREICNTYVLNLNLSDIRICDSQGDRVLKESDLTKKDWHNP